MWRRGSAPLPAEAENVVGAAVEAAVETTDVAVAGYQAAPAQENALFNLFASFVISLLASRAIAIVTRDEDLEPRLALLFGTGMGMTMDEAALLLELDDVYWTEEGLLSVQIGAGLVGLLGALAIGLRFLRRGEERVLPQP